MSPRIILLTRSLDYGGAERQLVGLAKELHSRGLPVHVVVFYRGNGLYPVLETAGVPVSIVGKKGRWDVPRFLMRLFRIVREEQPTVIYSYLTSPNLVALLLGALLHRTSIIWGVRSSNMALSGYGKLVSFNFWLSCRLSSFADLVIVNSYAGMHYYLRHGYPAKRSIVIPNGIDTERFVPDKNAGRRRRANWGVDGSTFLIGLIARLDPMKDHINFLKAASLLLSERTDVGFVCIGNGELPYKEKLKRFSKKLGIGEKLLWIDSCADMVETYNAFDIVTLASAYGEGFPNVLGEAMSCGKPCVATDIGDSAIIIGETGVIVPAGSPDRLSGAWLQTIGSLEEGKVDQQRIRGRIIDKYTQGVMAEKTLEALQGYICRD